MEQVMQKQRPGHLYQEHNQKHEQKTKIEHAITQYLELMPWHGVTEKLHYAVPGM